MSDVNPSIRTGSDGLAAESAVARQAPKSSFADAMAGKGFPASGVVGGPIMPRGAAVVAASITGTGMLRSSQSALGSSSSSTALTGVMVHGESVIPLAGQTGAALGLGVGGGGWLGPIADRAATGDASAQMMMASRQMQELDHVFNLQYLTLQQKIQGENRQYTALSNVMKSKHDTAKNALSNLK